MVEHAFSRHRERSYNEVLKADGSTPKQYKYILTSTCLEKPMPHMLTRWKRLRSHVFLRIALFAYHILVISEYNGYFRVHFASTSKRVLVHWKMSFTRTVHFYANQTHFLLNGFSTGLVVKRIEDVTLDVPFRMAFRFVANKHTQNIVAQGSENLGKIQNGYIWTESTLQVSWL